MNRSVVFASEWCRLLAEPLPDGEPYYMLEVPDYVTIVACTADGRMLLVRQRRPVVGHDTVELPSGHVEPGEASEAAARRELLEETGMIARHLELLGVLAPDVGRLTNRMWCYFASGLTPAAGSAPTEDGITLVQAGIREVLGMAMDGRMEHALDLAALFLAVSRRKLTLP